MFDRKKDSQPDIEVFVLYDTCSKSYDEPMLAKNKDVLMRDILNNFKTPESQQKNKYYLNASDYTIFKIGSYTKKDGLMEVHSHERIIGLHELRALAQPSFGDQALSPT